jgi:hypothetical protein
MRPLKDLTDNHLKMLRTVPIGASFIEEIEILDK